MGSPSRQWIWDWGVECLEQDEGQGDFRSLGIEVMGWQDSEEERLKEAMQKSYGFVRAMVRDSEAWETSRLWN